MGNRKYTEKMLKEKAALFHYIYINTLFVSFYTYIYLFVFFLLLCLYLFYSNLFPIIYVTAFLKSETSISTALNLFFLSVFQMEKLVGIHKCKNTEKFYLQLNPLWFIMVLGIKAFPLRRTLKTYCAIFFSLHFITLLNISVKRRFGYIQKIRIKTMRKSNV